MDAETWLMAAIVVAGGFAVWGFRGEAVIDVHRNAYLDRCTKVVVYSECVAAWDRELSK